MSLSTAYFAALPCRRSFFRGLGPLIPDLLDDAPSWTQLQMPDRRRCLSRETDTEFVVRVDLPGFRKADVSVEASPSECLLTVTASSPREGPDSGRAKAPEGQEGATEGQEGATEGQEGATEKAGQVEQGARSEQRVQLVRRFALPANVADVASARARLEDGVLTLTVPKVKSATPVKIPVLSD
eukprot:m51a1_g2739 hypothetical protein (184) ;mRNA; f:906444-906995